MTLAERLQQVIAVAHPRLLALAGENTAERTANRWSAREVLGHLIDSAANNHLRFVSAALQPEFQGPGYDQKGSVELHGYQELPWLNLLEFWRLYNDLILRVIARIPEKHLDRNCRIGQAAAVPLGLLIEDYITHLQHHLDQILGSPSFNRQ